MVAAEVVGVNAYDKGELTAKITFMPWLLPTIGGSEYVIRYTLKNTFYRQIRCCDVF